MAWMTGHHPMCSFPDVCQSFFSPYTRTHTHTLNDNINTHYSLSYNTAHVQVVLEGADLTVSF